MFQQPSAETDPLRTLSAEQKQQALGRYASIEKLVRWCQGDRFTVCFPDGRKVENSNDLAAWLAPQYGLTASGVWKRYMRWKKEGLKGLADKPRSDRGESRFFEKHPKAAKFVLAKAKERISLAFIHDALVREWSEMYPDGTEPPSYSTVRSYYLSIPEVLRDAITLTKEKHDARHSPHLLTDFTKLRPNQIWVSDHRIHDIFVMNDCLGQRDFAGIRLWETVIEDMRTRTIVASVWNLTPSSTTIASALRQGISRFGLPELFYVDNGKDYRKIGRGALREGWQTPADLDDEGRVKISVEAEGLLARLGIAVKYCIPRHPQSKLIESFFSGQAKRFDMIFGAAYAGCKPERRPDACHMALKAHKEFLQHKRMDTPLPRASEVINLANYWTEDFNAAHSHSGHGMDGRTPYEVFDDLLPADQRRMIDVTKIEELFWDRQKRVVANCTVQLYNATYEAWDEQAATQMYLANGSEILIACDPNNLGEALAFDKDHNFLGRLRAQKLVERGATSQDDIRQKMRLRSKLRKAATNFWNITTSGVPTELDLMRERAGIQPQPAPSLPPVTMPRLIGSTAIAVEQTVCAEDLAERFAEGD